MDEQVLVCIPPARLEKYQRLERYHEAQHKLLCEMYEAMERLQKASACPAEEEALEAFGMRLVGLWLAEALGEPLEVAQEKIEELQAGDAIT